MISHKNVSRGVSLMGIVSLAIAGFVYAASTGALLPNAVGTYNQFSVTGTSTHYMNVDEALCNGTTDYNFTTTVGQRDSYAVSISSIPDGAQLTSVAITPCASRNTSNKTATMKVFYRLGTAQSADSGAYALAANVTPAVLGTTNIGISGVASSTIKTSSSTLEVGAVYSSGTGGVRLSQITANVSYDTFNAPTGLSASAIGATSTSLSWTDNTSFETSYSIERGTDGVSYAQVGITGPQGTSSSYFDGSVSPATTYFYRVRAHNGGGYTSYSNVATTTTP